MASIETAPISFMDDLLNFDSDLENDVVEEENTLNQKAFSSSFTPASLGSALLNVLNPDDPTRPFVDSPLIGEEVVWISNEEAFTAGETFPDFLLNQEIFHSTKQNSPTSVLENPTISTTTPTITNCTSSILVKCNDTPRVPVKARSKRQQKQQQKQCSWWRSKRMVGIKAMQSKVSSAPRIPIIGRKCQHCGVEKTPQWRAGPLGAKTLCNACGVRFKSGRLVPEYRPANSPTFCTELHSNSHRKVLEMIKQKQIMGLPVVKPMGQDVG